MASVTLARYHRREKQRTYESGQLYGYCRANMDAENNQVWSQKAYLMRTYKNKTADSFISNKMLIQSHPTMLSFLPLSKKTLLLIS